MKKLLTKLYARYVGKVYIPPNTIFFVLKGLTSEGINAVKRDNEQIFPVHHKENEHVVIWS